MKEIDELILNNKDIRQRTEGEINPVIHLSLICSELAASSHNFNSLLSGLNIYPSSKGDILLKFHLQPHFDIIYHQS